MSTCSSTSWLVVEGFAAASSFLNGRYQPTGSTCSLANMYVNGAGGMLVGNDALPYYFLGNTSMTCNNQYGVGVSVFSEVFAPHPGEVQFWDVLLGDPFAPAKHSVSGPITVRCVFAPPLPWLYVFALITLVIFSTWVVGIRTSTLGLIKKK